MRNRLLILFQLLLIALLVSCRSSKPVASTKAPSVSASDYIDRYKEIAVSEMKRTGVPASITLAQGMIESNFGRSTLAREANNHFGIKCHNGWTGPTITHHDDRRNECFRKYKRVEDSYYDHSDFLKTGSRYKSLFELDNTDYKGWAKGLKKAGYATNPDYYNMLIRSIEENNLWYFDQGYSSVGPATQATLPLTETAPPQNLKVADNGKSAISVSSGVYARAPRVMETNRVQYIIVKDGDTKEKLEKEFKLLKWELAKYNELDNDFKPEAGQILYLQPKKDKAEAGKEYHIAVEGDTMYKISQVYGVKLKSLLEMNKMVPGAEPEQGKKVMLRSSIQGR